MTQQVLTITDIGANGDGIARQDTGDVVFVPFTAMGDVVLVDVSSDHDGIKRGKIISLEKESPQRKKPPCRHFGICGGCALQHLDEETYQSFKKKNVIDALARAQVTVPETIDAIFIPPGTRRRANFAARVVRGRAIIGFHERRSATIRDVPDCLLINEPVRKVMEAFRPFIPDIAGDGQKMDVLIQCVGGVSEIALTGKLAPGWAAQQALSDALRTIGLARISIRARDYDRYEILLEEKPYYVVFDSLGVNLAPGAFLQPSDEGERALVDCVIAGAGDAPRAADLFCGNGTFTGPLLVRHDVVAVDSASDSIKALKKASVNAIERNLFKDPMSEKELEDRDMVVLDPPRAGAVAQVKILSNSALPKIVYVSCNPQSFAKDAALLIEGGYDFEKLTIVDQFTWSAHVELVGIFTKAR